MLFLILSLSCAGAGVGGSLWLQPGLLYLCRVILLGHSHLCNNMNDL